MIDRIKRPFWGRKRWWVAALWLLAAFGCGEEYSAPIATMKPVVDRLRAAERVSVTIEGAGLEIGGEENTPREDETYELTDAAAIGVIAGLINGSAPVHCDEGAADIGIPLASVLVYEKSGHSIPDFRVEVSSMGYIAVYFPEKETVCLPADPHASELYRRLDERDFSEPPDAVAER